MERPPTINRPLLLSASCDSPPRVARRWRTTLRTAAAAIAAAGALACAGVASAQLKGSNFQCQMDSSNMVTVTDADTGRVLISPNRMPLWFDGGEMRVPAVAPQVAFESRPDGFNAHFTFVNNTTRRASLGEIYVPGIRFGQTLATRDFRVDGKPSSVDHRGQNFADGGLCYPEACYAPVAVIASEGYTIGASLHYPILDYKHRVFIRVESPGGKYIFPGRNWQILFRLNPLTPTGLYSEEGELAPGETRRYTLSVRILKSASNQHANEWLRTLEPYRRYFKSLYGDVRYQRDPRPMLGHVMAATMHLKPDNQLGFHPYQRYRADKYGFGPWVDRFNRMRAAGWERGTLWAPSGMFYRFPAANYPFQFTSQWQRYPAMAQSVRELKSLSDRGFDLGLWWGRSGQVMTTWDTPNFQVLDPNNQEHRRLAFKELDGAAAAGAKTIGLDTFTHIPLWDAYPWLLEMESRCPEMKFVVEPAGCDVLHTIAASYTLATTAEDQRPCQVMNPHFLADFLNPGHETWGAIHVGYIRESMGLPYNGDISPAQLQREIVRYASMGYVANPFTDMSLTPPMDRYDAVESWRTTVPTGDQETYQPTAQESVTPPEDPRTTRINRIMKKIQEQPQRERRR